MDRSKKKVEDSRVIMTQLILPEHTNDLGTVFGGQLMSWVDIAAAICARRHAQRNVVTASVDALSFLAPIRLGWIATLQASVNYVWSSSCEIGVKVTAENPSTGETFHTASAYVTMVALDSNGRPCKITPLEPQGEEEERRFEEAQQRREARLQLKKEIAAKRVKQKSK